MKTLLIVGGVAVVGVVGFVLYRRRQQQVLAAQMGAPLPVGVTSIFSTLGTGPQSAGSLIGNMPLNAIGNALTQAPNGWVSPVDVMPNPVELATFTEARSGRGHI